MPLSDRLPTPLSERLALASAQLYSRQGREYDVAIGGVPFMLATTPELPQTEETVPIRREQVDTEVDPGEQSLGGSWWRRSQASFHRGAGFRYAEDITSNEPGEGFWDSRGVDVFTPGQLSLLRKMEKSSEIMRRTKTFSVTASRTNYCTNPAFGASTAGWIPSDGGGPATDEPTITQVTTAGEGIPEPLGYATQVGRLTWGTDDATGDPPSLRVPSATIGADATFTVKVYVYVPSGSPSVSLHQGSDQVSSGSVRDQWTPLVMTSSISGGGSTPSLTLEPDTPVSSGDLFYVCLCLIEEGVSVGSYFDGYFQDAEWTGTPDLSSSVYTIDSGGIEKVAIGTDGRVWRTDGDDIYNQFHLPAGKNIVDVIVSGAFFYDIADDGTLFAGDVAQPTLATSWPCNDTTSRMLWAKHRLWIIGGNKIWQPDLTLAAGSSQAPAFTHPNAGWRYTSMIEGPGAMYFGGHDGLNSSIQAIVLDESGGVPTLTGATITAVLPQGELVQELSIVAGQYIGIGTNRGFRVGVVTPGSATLTYGPLLIEPEGVIRCTVAGAQGRFLLVGFETEQAEPLLYRIDTGLEVENGLFPYATDVEVEAGAGINSLAISGNQLIVTVVGGGEYTQSATELVDEGWIEASRIRYRTTEHKRFRFLDVEIEPLHGNIACEAILETGATLALGTISQTGELFNDRFSFRGVGKMRYVSPRFTLTPDPEDPTEGPVLNSFMVRATPAVTPQRLITLPLLCFDQEQSRSGQRYGGSGYARDRLRALQWLEDNAEVVTYQDFSHDDSTGRQVMIESVRFVRTNPPSPTRQEGAGGTLVVELRTMEG